MAFKGSSIDVKTKYLTDVSTFEGVDYTTQRFKVNSSRAIDLSNFIYKDGVVQVRNGIEQLAEVNATNYIPTSFSGTETDVEYKTNATNINGLWTITGEDNVLHLIAHIGCLLYEVKNIENPMYMSVEPIVVYGTSTTYHNGKTYYHVYEFENYKSSAFVGSKRLYFLGGNQFVCVRFIKQDNGTSISYIYPIEDNSDTYIPTTTISITYKDSAVASRESLDNVNLMTQWRKNELISGTLKSDTIKELQGIETEDTENEVFDYTLDAPLICKNGESDMSDILITLEYRGTINYGK